MPLGQVIGYSLLIVFSFVILFFLAGFFFSVKARDGENY